MTVARAIQVNIDNTPYYHCVSRCVRRAFLCGQDYQTGKSFDHRKDWVINRIKHLASIYCIEISAYAIMSNHFHLVVFIDRERALSLTEQEVYTQWGLLCPQDADKYQGLDFNEPIMQAKLQYWRAQLWEIGSFMKRLNEYIAKLANAEDDCKGRFWEGRFKTYALLDECAILSAMAYVDLNPIRAGIAKTPETSEFTSIYERIQYVAKQRKSVQANKSEKIKPEALKSCDTLKQPYRLMPFLNNRDPKKCTSPFINFKLSDYLLLVDMTGRILHEDKKGKIPESCVNILTRLNFTTEGWFDMVKNMETSFSFAIGSPVLLSAFGAERRSGSPKGISAARRIYLSKAA